VVFWFSDGIVRYSSVACCWWKTALRRLTFGISGPYSVLVLVQPLDVDGLDWEQLQTQLPGLFEF